MIHWTKQVILKTGIPTSDDDATAFLQLAGCSCGFVMVIVLGIFLLIFGVRLAWRLAGLIGS